MAKHILGKLPADAFGMLELPVLPARLLLKLLDLALECSVFHRRAQELAERWSGGIVGYRERHVAEALGRFFSSCVEDERGCDHRR